MLFRAFTPLVLLALSAVAADIQDSDTGALRPIKRLDGAAARSNRATAPAPKRSTGQQQDLQSVGCDTDGVWCLIVTGDRSKYNFSERKYTKEVKLSDGRHVFKYGAGTADGITLTNGDSGLSYLFSSFVSAATVTPWTKGPRTFASFTTVDKNKKTNANGWTGEHTVFSVEASSDDLYFIIPSA
ncbi:hypothetical protein OC834_006291 [Tilletia horrida]|nr:hypothetical protein OC834_006291 [Tilletia horrida]